MCQRCAKRFPCLINPPLTKGGDAALFVLWMRKQICGRGVSFKLLYWSIRAKGDPHTLVALWATWVMAHDQLILLLALQPKVSP